MSKDKKKTEIYLSEDDIRERTQRWRSVINDSDVELLVRECNKEPITQHEFTSRLLQIIQMRHVETNSHLKPLGESFRKDYERLAKNFPDYTQRLELLRSGSDKFGKTPVMMPLHKKDIAYIIGYWEQNYQKVETGKISITIDLLIKLCAFFQVSADIILFGFHPFETGEVTNKSLIQEKNEEENKFIQEKDRIIEDLRDTIDLYREKVKKLEQEMNYLKK